MSLMKKRTMTDRQKAAARANGSKSQGPATRQGRENIRAANLRHGLYSQAENVVLESLGEDRERFESLHEGLIVSFPLASGPLRALVDELMAAIWRLERIERKQEELSIEQDKALADWNLPLEQSPAFDPNLTSLLMSMEEVTSREVLRLSNQLLEFETEERNRPLRGLPEKLLKKKGKNFRGDEDFDDRPGGWTRPAGTKPLKEAELTVGDKTGEGRTSYMGITPESNENKG